jgi:hypothetical protein
LIILLGIFSAWLQRKDYAKINIGYATSKIAGTSVDALKDHLVDLFKVLGGANAEVLRHLNMF